MIQTLENYCKEKYNEYIDLNYDGAKKYQNFILSRSKNDVRLALVAQSFYYAKGEFEIAHKFVKFTHEDYKNKTQFLNSQNKYVYQYNHGKFDTAVAKSNLKKMIEKTMYEQGLSYYKVSKKFKVSRSKMYDFFEYGKTNVFSVERLIKLNKKLNKEYNNH